MKGLKWIVRRLIWKEALNLLKDVDYRIGVLAELQKEAGGKISSIQLILPRHILDGFTFTDNSPVAGKVAWAGCHIVYKGTDYTITDGNTDLKYIWWDYDAAPNTAFQASATKPALSDDDCLVCINDGGIHRLVIGATMPHGAFLLGTTVDTGELKDSSVATAKLAAGSVLSEKLGDGAVIEAKIGAEAVTAGKVGTGAITEGKIYAGAVTEGKLGALAVTTAKVADGAVVTAKMADGNVTTTKLADGGITTVKMADGSVTTIKLTDGVITTAKLEDGAVTGAKAAAGAFNASKLNLIEHILY